MGPDNLNPLVELKSLERQIEQVNELAGLKPGTLVQADVSKRSYVSKSGPRTGLNLAAGYPIG